MRHLWINYFTQIGWRCLSNTTWHLRAAWRGSSAVRCRAQPRPHLRGRSPSEAADQRWPLLQTDGQTVSPAAATFISSYECFVALGNCLSLLFGKPDPADSFTAASGPSSVFSNVPFRVATACSSGFGVIFRLVSLSACLLFLFLGYFYYFPRLHFLLCILFLPPNFLPAIWMLSKIISQRVGILALGHSWSQQAPWWLPTLSHSGTSCAASVAASKWQWHHSGKEQLASYGRTGRLQDSHEKQNLSYSSGTQEKEQAVPLNLPNYLAVTHQVFFATWRTSWLPSCSHAFLLRFLNCCVLRNPYSLLSGQAEWRTLPRRFSQ